MKEQALLKGAATIRFWKLAANCHPGVPEFKKKFDSFYRKIKRWAAKENWDEWIKRKETEERRTREEEVGTRTMHLSEEYSE